MRASSKIVCGSFFGGEVEPGTFHCFDGRFGDCANCNCSKPVETMEQERRISGRIGAPGSEGREPVLNRHTDFPAHPLGRGNGPAEVVRPAPFSIKIFGKSDHDPHQTLSLRMRPSRFYVPL
jgi:hypothetical protein